MIEGLVVDHRADIGAPQLWITDGQLVQGAANHRDHGVCNAFVHTQQAQR